MRRRLVRAATTAATCAALTATALVAPFTGTATAAPCGSTSNGSSGVPLPSFGSLGSSNPEGPPEGPQGPLPYFNNGTTKAIAWVTGPRSENRTLTRFGISGTDIGAAWDNGSGQTLMAFGDTFGNCSAPGNQWRHNVLLRTDDNDLADGLTVADGIPGVVTSGASVSAAAPNMARQMIDAIGWSGVEVTTIPTSGISIDGKQYMNYMSVRAWGSAGRWDTNFSAIAVSSDNGQTWSTPLDTLRVNAGVTVPLPPDLPEVKANNAKFQQSAYVAGHGADSGWIYQFGTPNGRFGSAYLARFRPDDILDLSSYEYWTGSTWANSIDAIPDTNAPKVFGAPVTELSVAWSEYLGKYIMLHSPPTGLQMRTADRPEGPWSLPRNLVRPTYGIYAPMMLPHSPALLGTGPELYYNGSLWADYNVVLMRTTLRR
ncbi:DUF4185 domain-containing protein [Gordonia sp. (in: high G+C Gram-positive bacteria)]|uniref:DUF4185 domain-containing protein n=1 Tax=Gordonia sp. (in: high G+C Gram-positive bacteria) TaxID=84139 RepID=UPI0016B7EA76|nr:DUF4185 domain-containing protein [Gordonia sp. (in: high G+C Gram-positive bacteria)]NLG46028.1 DUF4185 domain-containing protein [Gordonia sp. (in: high G+C Gram-positive bacteria)]